MSRLLMLVLVLCLGSTARSAPTPANKKSDKEALQAFQDLIGDWKGTGVPSGTREEREQGFWSEKVAWQWKFKGKAIWLQADIAKGKWFARLELRYVAAKDLYVLKATKGKESWSYEGKLANKRLTLERTDPKTKDTQRIVFTLLHSNRYLCRYEVCKAEQTLFSQKWQTGNTKQGVPFASKDDGKPECIVSGGLGTSAVTYKGKTYYVCCSGCRDAFNDEPEKYIKEFEAKKKAKKSD